MRVTQGFVAVTEQGEFLYVGQRSTHTGHHVDVSPVSGIDRATVHAYPRLTDRNVERAMPKGYRMVPVEVRREVVLTGFGVEKA